MELQVIRALTATWGLFALCPSAAAVQPAEIYRRATPVEIRTGVVAVRSVHGALLNIPVDCDRGSLRCEEAASFPIVYAASFALENRESREQITRIDLTARGTVYLALRFDADDEAAFDEELRRTFAALSPDAFVESFASLESSQLPFATIGARSIKPSWTCFEDGSSRRVTRYSRKARKHPDGTLGVSSVATNTFQEDEISRTFCEAAAALFETVHPEEIRTTPLPRILWETSVHARIESALKRDAYPDDLVILPEGVTLTVEPVRGGSEELSSATDGSFVKASRTANGVKHTALARSAELPPGAVTRNAFLLHWTVEATERRLGPLPTETLLARENLVVALLPAFPPAHVDETGQPRPVTQRETYSVRFDPEAFLEEVAERLNRQAHLDLASLEEAVAVHPAGLGSDGWILVICRPDGTADYWLPPTRAHSRVTNADLFCTAAESRLD